MLLFPPFLHKVSQRFALQRYNKKCKYATTTSIFNKKTTPFSERGGQYPIAGGVHYPLGGTPSYSL